MYRRIIIWFFGFDYFISYSHGDATAYVQELHHQLSQSHLGFVDTSGEGLFVGSSLAREIRNALRRTKVLIVVYTDAVADKKWTKLECRYFKKVRPNRPFIPISADANSATLQHQLEVLFDSDRSELSEVLQHWLKPDEASVLSSSTIDPLWAVESKAKNLGETLPSETIVEKIRDSFYGTSVPRKGAYSIAGAMIVGCCALLLGWTQYAGSQGNAALAELSQLSSEIKEKNDTLVAEIHASNISQLAERHENSFDDEFEIVLEKLASYDFYRSWDFSSGYRGMAISLYSVPDFAKSPRTSFPKKLNELRLTGEHLSEDWLIQLQNLDSCRLLALNFNDVASESKLIDIINSLEISELEIEKCRRISLETLRHLDDEACNSLRALLLSYLDDFSIESHEKEKHFMNFLARCKQLKKLKLRELPNCRLAALSASELSVHPTLSKHGAQIRLDHRLLAADFELDGNADVVVWSPNIKEIDQLE